MFKQQNEHSQNTNEDAIIFEGICSIFDQVIQYNLALASLCLINCKAVYEKRKIVPNQVIQVSITCSKHILYNLIFTTKVNDSSILITIISWNYLNLSLANKYVDDVTIPTQVIKHNQCCSRQISQSDCSIHIKLNYSKLLS